MLSDLWLHLKEHIISLIAKLWVNFCGAAMSALLSVTLKGFFFNCGWRRIYLQDSK